MYAAVKAFHLKEVVEKLEADSEDVLISHEISLIYICKKSNSEFYLLVLIFVFSFPVSFFI